MSDSTTVSVVVQQPNGFLTILTAPAMDFNRLNVWDWCASGAGFLLIGVCVCRLNALQRDRHRLSVQMEYLIMFVSSVILTFSPWMFPEDRTVGTFIFVVGMVISTLMSTPAWRNGAPESAESRPADLFALEDFNDRRNRTLGGRIRRVWCGLHGRVTLGTGIHRRDK